MIVVLAIAVLAGIVTAVSPCVLPVLPVVFAGGAGGGRRRPFAIVAGLVTSFCLATLFAAWALHRLGLPADLLRDLALALLFALAATLVVPRLGELLERPLLFLTRRRGSDLGGGFVLGASLGLVFVPCGGPVLSAIAAQAAAVRFGAWTLLVTLAYGVGAALPLLAVAAGGRRASVALGIACDAAMPSSPRRPRLLGVFRSHGPRVRAALGVVIAVAAVAILEGWDTTLQRSLGDYTSSLQAVEKSSYARHKLDTLRKSPPPVPTYQRAPDFAGITGWLNSRPLTMAKLRGKVVLVDFWTYSCINCLRTLPHLEAWDAAYRKDGLVIVGVHTPEFAFEHVAANVERAVRRYGIRYPVALDPNYGTWNAWHNEYWPAEFLVDARGRLRHAQFGEGDYGATETLIRRLLGERAARARRARPVADATPSGLLTPESYLGAQRLARYAGSPLRPGRFAPYELPRALQQDELAFGGSWKLEPDRIVAGPGARLRLRFRAREVYVVLAGRGSVSVLVNGAPRGRIAVAGARLYTAASSPRLASALLELRVPAGVAAYSFTFG